MSSGITLRKEHRPYVKAALAHGGSVTQHNGHVKVFDAEGHYVCSLSAGRKGGAGMKRVAKAWRERGWID